MRRLIAIAAAWTAVTGAAQAADAQPRGWRATGSLTVDARYQRARPEPGQDRASLPDLATFGVDLRAMFGAPFLMYGAAFDYQVGASYPGGFAYETHLSPVGLGWLIGESATIAAYGGVGVSGVTGRIPAAARFPIDVVVEFQLGDRVRVAGRARAAWVSGESRADGSPNAPLGDELDAALTLRWGRRYYPHDYTMSAGSGYYLGALYGERLQGRFLGLVFGYSMDASYGDRGL